MATEGETTNMLFNVLIEYFDVVMVIIEDKISKKRILINRKKRIGVVKVIGQVLFIGLISPVLKRFSLNRINQIIADNKYSKKSIPNSKIQNVDSVNNREIINLVHGLKPNLIFVNGTRIISKQIIDKLGIKMINIHVGITPKYRGVHGGYWALYNENKELFGTTLHYIDSGVDTGFIIAQKIVKVSAKDNYSTYPIIQFCAGLNLLEDMIPQIYKGNIKQKISLSNESGLYYHPTISQYLIMRFLKGVK